MVEAFFRALKSSACLLRGVRTWRLDDLTHILLFGMSAYYQSIVSLDGSSKSRTFTADAMALEAQAREIVSVDCSVRVVDVTLKQYYVASLRRLRQTPPVLAGYLVDLLCRSCTCPTESVLVCKHLRAAARFAKYDLPLLALRQPSNAIPAIPETDFVPDASTGDVEPDVGIDGPDIDAGVASKHSYSALYVSRVHELLEEIMTDTTLSRAEVKNTLREIQYAATHSLDQYRKDRRPM